MTVREIIIEGLKAKGYDGIYFPDKKDDCQCKIADIAELTFSCMYQGDCIGGYLQPDGTIGKVKK